MLPCCLRLLFSCISKAKIENSIVSCVTVNFPPPFSCSWFEGFHPCSERDNARVLCKAHYLLKVWTGARILACANIGTESMCPGTRVPALGGRNSRVVDVCQKSGQSFLLYLPAKREPVISPCSRTMGHELTKLYMCRVCSVSIHLSKGLDLCALKIWWIKETWKCVLMQGIVKSCLPEMQADKCSGPKGSSLSFSRDAQSNRIRARHLGLFAKDLPPDCLCTYCRLMKVCRLRAQVDPASLALDGQ